MLNLIGVLCINLAINTWGTLMFQLDTFPSWANTTNEKPWEERSKEERKNDERAVKKRAKHEEDYMCPQNIRNVSCSKTLSSFSTGLNNTQQTFTDRNLSICLFIPTFKRTVVYLTLCVFKVFKAFVQGCKKN